ncbi:hypothetical protein JBO49_12740 [Serratia fonticola]|uniref:hypothetical protein n=2 Tax=Serratia fonticola TaxID=47917 RepID=UPI00192B3F09|nr:hypothetical protein [Serratia fonticola]MBL5861483.1 hypothetical protein [Serratia fonticola]
MRKWLQIMTAALLLSGITVNAADTPLGSVNVSIELTNLPQITVQKPGGGWYDTLRLNNSAGSDVTRYEAQVNVEVNIRNGSDFTVSLVRPMSLTNESDPTLIFINELVQFGSSGTTLQTLSSIPLDFSNTIVGGGISTGLYVITVGANEPAGGFRNVVGNYVGELVLMFEAKV